MRRFLTLAFASTLFAFTLAACGEEEDKEAVNKNCQAAPAWARSGRPVTGAPLSRQ